MPDYISKIKFPDEQNARDIKDANALPKTTTINSVSKDTNTDSYTLYGNNINISTGYTPPTSGAYVAPAVNDSLETAIGKLAYGLNQATAGSIISVDEDPTSHLDITTLNGAVTVDVAIGYVIPPDTVQASASGGSTLTLVSTGDKYTWDSKQDAIAVGSELNADLVDDSTSTNKFVTATDISNWNDKQDEITFDGTYDASTNPAATVSTVTSATADLLDGVKAYDTTEEDYVTVPDTKLVAGNNVTITPNVSSETITIAATDTTYNVFTDLADGLVPAADGTGETGMFLKGDGTWATPTNTTYSQGTGINIDGSNVISNTGVTAVTASNATTGTNGTISVTTNGTTAEVPVKGLDTAAYATKETTIGSTPSTDNVPTSSAVATYVATAISQIPEPMIFKGGITLTADSSDTTKCSITLPSGVSSVSEGYTFKVTAIAASPVYTGTFREGDTFIADTDNPTTTASWVADTDWTVIPSGDDPSGTVTEVAATDGITTASGSAISSTGTVKLDMVSSHTITGQSAGAITTTTDRTYPVGLDSNNKVAVNIPWTNTTYTFGTGSTNGTISVTPSGGSASDVPVYGLGTAAYTASTDYATASHNQAISTITGISTTGTAVTNVSTTATTAETGYISVSSYDSDTKTLTLKGILAPKASTFVQTTS